jgi:hypothetical protein
MGIVILIVCLSMALNLALWSALYRVLDGVPLRIFSLSRQDRAADEAHALAVLEAAAAARVNVLTLSLRSYDEQLAERSREAVAAAELRARVAERRSTDAVSALGAASALVRELRTLVTDLPPRELPPPPGVAPRSSPPALRDSGESGAWVSDRPSDAEGDRTRIGTLPSREALGLPPTEAVAATCGEGGGAP